MHAAAWSQAPKSAAAFVSLNLTQQLAARNFQTGFWRCKRRRLPPLNAAD